jgi:hypothetical protein
MHFTPNSDELSLPFVALYDGDEGDPPAGDPPAGDPPAGDPPAGDPNAPVSGDPNARFSTEQVNKIVQERLAKAQKKHQENSKKMEVQLQQLLASQSLTAEERSNLENQLEDLRKQFRTKEEQAKIEKKELQTRFETDLDEAKKAAVHWENKYKSSTIKRALQDAATQEDAFKPSQVVTLLLEHTKLVEATDENGKGLGKLIPMVDLPDVEAETLKPIVTQRTPEDAVKRLKELDPNLFKANIVAGVGGSSATGGTTPGSDGKVDAKDLTPAQYAKLRKENPEALGLRRRRR